MKAAQAWMKAKIPIAPKAESETGAMTRIRIHHSDAPAIRAA